jgi:hypothetical protein
MPGIGEVIEGAMQQAPQLGRHSIPDFNHRCTGCAQINPVSAENNLPYHPAFLCHPGGPTRPRADHPSPPLILRLLRFFAAIPPAICSTRAQPAPRDVIAI